MKYLVATFTIETTADLMQDCQVCLPMVQPKSDLNLLKKQKPD